MSSGRTHRLVNLTAAVLIPGGIGVSYYLGGWLALGTVSGGYLLSTFGVNPDKDLVGRTYDERKGWRGNFLFLLGIPYGIIFRHRGISHVHFMGTLSRVLFMGLWIIPLLLLLAGVPPLPLAEYSGWFFVGLTIADSMHIAADGGQRQREHRQ